MKVLIDAYLEGNFGDDLLVYIICRRYKNVDFYIFADDEYKKTISINWITFIASAASK